MAAEMHSNGDCITDMLFKTGFKLVLQHLIQSHSMEGSYIAGRWLGVAVNEYLRSVFTDLILIRDQSNLQVLRDINVL